MQLTILRIENEIVRCQLDTGMFLDIARRWFTEYIQDGDTIELDLHNEDEAL